VVIFPDTTIMDIHMEDAGSNEEPISIRIRPGYTEEIHNNKTYIRPSVLGTAPNLARMAMIKKADLSQAVEMPGGVSGDTFLSV
jgi:hypothetical protein